jgi:hypothetical protein
MINEGNAGARHSFSSPRRKVLFHASFVRLPRLRG